MLNEAKKTTVRFETLDGASDQLTPGTTLQIRTNGIIDLGQCVIETDDVTIMAAEGFTPTLQFVPNSEEEAEAMLIVEGELSLVGLELRLPNDANGDAHALIGVCEGGVLGMTRCRLMVENTGFCVTSESEATINIDSCELHNPNSSVIGVFDEDGGSLAIRDSWVTGEVGFQLSGIPNQKVSIRNSKLICGLAFEFTNDEFEEGGDPWTIYMDSSLLLATQALAEAEWGQLSLGEVSELFQCVGRHNTFAGKLFDFEERDVWEQWLEDLHQLQSKYVENPLDASLDSIVETLSTLEFPRKTLRTKTEILDKDGV